MRRETRTRRRTWWLCGWACAGLVGALALPSRAAEKPREPTVLGKLIGSYEGPDVSPDGLELTRFQVSSFRLPPSTGQMLIAGFTLTNRGSRPIHLGPGGLALAARIEPKDGPAQERRIGARHGQAVIEPGGYLLFTSTGKMDVAGRWRVAPTCEYVGGRCPERWHEIALDVAATPGWVPPEQERAEMEERHARLSARNETLLGRCEDGNTLPHGLHTALHVRGLRPPRAGDRLKVEVLYQNMHREPQLFGKKGVFVAARFTPKGSTTAQVRDFGHQFPYVVLRMWSPASINVTPEVTVDGPGTWVFWPSFEIDGEEAPERWCPATVEVEESHAR